MRPFFPDFEAIVDNFLQFESGTDRLSFVIRLPCHPLTLGEITATEQVIAQVTVEVQRLLVALDGEMSRQQLADALGMTHREHFRRAYLKPALDAGLVEMTLVTHANL